MYATFSIGSSGSSDSNASTPPSHMTTPHDTYWMDASSSSPLQDYMQPPPPAECYQYPASSYGSAIDTGATTAFDMLGFGASGLDCFYNDASPPPPYELTLQATSSLYMEPNHVPITTSTEEAPVDPLAPLSPPLPSSSSSTTQMDYSNWFVPPPQPQPPLSSQPSLSLQPHQEIVIPQQPPSKRKSSSTSSLGSSTSVNGDIRPYVCSACPRAFARKHDLQRHIRVHTGDKPYVCLCCKKAFARTDALKRHLRMEDTCRMSPEVQAMKCAGKRRYRNL
ncbi:hypothetical protein RO3G_13382 [Lichtheimia corymbifera JMRC:FSU:9682]|uniref:C2H2-type domain-containing protein n=1 Tax=Lichtheimia corymbifera JMRC:FSU:9682 TaxID=1263082 RepID=A0A068RLF6_9FUNG|nr:hypothetical protein RO3G_13382 [Lichtheimia corymbifera JMRC:FSU:9682]